MELNQPIEENIPEQVLSEAKSRITDIASKKTQFDDQPKQQIEAEWDHAPIAISRLRMEITKVVAPDTDIVDDCCSSSGMLRQILDLAEHRRFFVRERAEASVGGCPVL